MKRVYTEEQKARRRAYWRKRYKDDKEYKQQQLTNRKVSIQKTKELVKVVISEFRKFGCSLCDEKSHACLAAHHLDPKEKELKLGDASAGRVAVERVIRELSKCVCLCHNCHAKLHVGEVSLKRGGAVR